MYIIVSTNLASHEVTFHKSYPRRSKASVNMLFHVTQFLCSHQHTHNHKIVNDVTNMTISNDVHWYIEIPTTMNDQINVYSVSILEEKGYFYTTCKRVLKKVCVFTIVDVEEDNNQTYSPNILSNVQNVKSPQLKENDDIHSKLMSQLLKRRERISPTHESM